MKASGKLINIDDLRRRAAQRMPRPVFAFLEGGAEDERTVARNRDAFADWSLIPRSLVDVSTVDSATRLFGVDVAWPFVVGPTGMPGLFDVSGELAIARAAENAGALYTLSTMATRSIEEVAAATTAPKLFQLYVFRDRGITRELIQRARDAGYAGIVLTVDVQVPANRERDKRTGMTLPPRLTAATIAQFAQRPRWCWDQLVRRRMALANFSDHRAAPGMSLLSYINEQFDPRITWKDVDWVAREWGGPIGLKGILRGDDAAIAPDNGVSTIILSNHGGRQLDSAVSPMDTLEDAIERVADRAEIILDGGIRRGTDMLKALALGAAGCMSGRVGLYGLAAKGEAGAHLALTILRDEFRRDLALLGTPSVDAVRRDSVTRIR